MRKLLVSVAIAFAAVCSAGGANAQTATQDININATVTSYCTINGAVTGAAVTTATIPVTLGVVNPATINRTIANVACNNITNVVATSQAGGVTTGGAAPSGSSNIIDYTGTATFGGATSTINTATVATAAGNETGNTGTTAGAATGNLVVDIVPAQPALPLTPSAAYADVLTVTLTAQ